MNYLNWTAPVSQVRLLAGDTASLLWVRMDISVLPNNNHPEKFLQLDVRMLPASCGAPQVGALLFTQRHWQNRVYDQRDRRPKTDRRPPAAAKTPAVTFVDRYLEKHISSHALTSNIKMNPLFPAPTSVEEEDSVKVQPSWTVEEYNTRTCARLAEHLKEGQKTPKDLDFWLEDVYTPGFDSLLKKTEAQLKRRSRWRFFCLAVVSIGAVVTVIVIPVVLLQRTS
ncbi:major intrinsically disordered NOTCH2-binding receptor 1-like isoform X1 [Takifugu rubripes]|uniref:Major intrinsically disordered Notch2-binding receptor 1-like C-terminal domain-containing protein n=1 Tax=Takifugu rubripes TaxID=31033 RepID=H2RW76_TAKRU|nr:major intrinsically disordered NOTCH2-binding receptor 1-like isoform X1 [Takifugu rubripes]